MKVVSLRHQDKTTLSLAVICNISIQWNGIESVSDISSAGQTILMVIGVRVRSGVLRIIAFWKTTKLGGIDDESDPLINFPFYFAPIVRASGALAKPPERQTLRGCPAIGGLREE